MRPGYGSAWEDYWVAGWTPVPLTRGTKYPPPEDVTGNKPTRYDPDVRDFKKWAAENPRGNLMITMPKTVIGIDTDVYAGGGDTLDRLLGEYGDLPSTWESSSREDGSGIGLYRVPAGTRLVSKTDPGIQYVQYHHRYCVAWPSRHPEGRTCKWWYGTTEVGIPKVSELPDLPKRWIKGLADQPRPVGMSPYNGDLDDWLAALPDLSEGFTRAPVRKILRNAQRAFGNGDCRHDAMVSATGALVAMGAQGRPVYQAIHELADLFIAAMADERDGEYEYWSAVGSAVAKFGGGKPKRQWPTAPWLAEEAVTR